MGNDAARARFRERVRKSLEEADAQFKGLYKDEINGLLGLSKTEIDAITPDATDLEVYNKLITVVKEASQANIDQAELKSTIHKLGAVAITIAKKVPSLAALV
jgi:hypothetical protein